MQETQETQVQSLGQEDPLEKEMATYSIIVAWKISRTGELGGLQSRGMQSQTRLNEHAMIIKIKLHFCNFQHEGNFQTLVIYLVSILLFFCSTVEGIDFFELEFYRYLVIIFVTVTKKPNGTLLNI